MGRVNKPPRPRTTGVIVIDKPKGITSMGAVAGVRRRAGGAKTGHAGTLDPLATGVLVMALGKATKIIDKLMATEKRYHTVIDLSAFTATDDREGEREEVEVDEPPSRADVGEALAHFRGPIMQRPPAHSAVKIDGRRSYKLARQGEGPEPKAREVVMHSLELVSYDWPLVELSLHCGKGMYVRSLARDLGGVLATGGHCASIRRTAVGPFTIEEATKLDDVPEPLVEEHLISVEEALRMVGGGEAG